MNDRWAERMGNCFCCRNLRDLIFIGEAMQFTDKPRVVEDLTKMEQPRFNTIRVYICKYCYTALNLIRRMFPDG